PHPAVVASDHSEAVVAVREIGIKRLPPRPDVMPIGLPAFELVAEEYLFGSGEAECGVVYLQVAHQRGQSQALIHIGSRIVVFAVGGDLLDVYRRGKAVEWKVARIDDAHSVQTGEPQLSIRGPGYLWADARSIGPVRYSVGVVENRSLDRRLRIFI